jgi:hypothetical protein
MTAGSLYSPEQIERVRREQSLVDLVGKRVKLRRAGRRWSGLCPFHKEQTPSFTVGEAKGGGESFHCFGCGAHGDLFDWLEQVEGWPFLEAMKHLLAGEKPDARHPTSPAQREALKAPSDVVSSTFAGRWIYHGSGPARGEIVEQWLKARGLDPFAEFVPGAPAIDQLLFHPRCPLGAWRVDDDPHQLRSAPAMVAPFRDALGQVRGVHVTWLSPDGSRKAELPRMRDGKPRPDRKMLGRVDRCAVFLTPFEASPEAGPLVVGEGLETVWSFAQGLGRPCRAAAALSLENLQGGAVRLKGGALPLWNLRANPERPPFLLPDAGEVIALVDADMKPLQVQRHHQTQEPIGPRLQLEAGAKPVIREIGAAERAEICAQLATQHWRRAGATRVRAERPRMGLDFNDAAIAGRYHAAA